MGFGATLEVLTSREFKVSGAIGPVTSLGKKSPNVSDLEVGRGGTNAWSLGGIDPGTTIAIYFDITNPGVSLVFPLGTCCIRVDIALGILCCSISLPWLFVIKF